MCGIAGILRISSSASVPPHEAIPEAWLDILDEGIKHRGPDGQGRFRDRVVNAQGQTIDVALVHRRLSIIDHNDGAQPMVAQCGSAIAFNGCIYNHRDLRQQLKQLGREFVTHHSDTEALLQGWLQWGTGLFARVDGMYAAAWWDRANASVMLARDAFGEKPLYWATLANRDGVSLHAFASTVPALVRLYKVLNSGECPLEPSDLNHWIKFGWGSATPYRHINELRPGTILDLSNPEETEQETSNNTGPEIDALQRSVLNADQVDQLLRGSVHSRLEADVPMGFFLSGGLDSALICKYAAEVHPELTAYTVQMPDPAFDESAHARETAAFLRISHMVLECDANPAEDLENLMNQLGLPFGDSSLLPSMWVSRAARKVSTVAIGGDGGDELFMGYDRHRAIKLLWQMSFVPHALRQVLSKCISLDANPKSLRTRAARFLSAAANNDYAELLANFPSSLCSELGIASISGRCRSAWSGAVASARQADVLEYLPCDLLRKSDTASMQVALELRAPFLSLDLARAALRADVACLMPRGQRKGLLREVARRYLPDSIVDRPKQGFAIPIGDWFRTGYGGMKTLLLDTINSADPFPESKLGISLNRNAVNRLVDEHMQKKRDHSQRLYMLMVLGIWARI